MLPRRDRIQLTELMLLDVLEAFRAAGMISWCFVVSSDRNARILARNAGANFIAEARDRGVNASVLTGIGETRSAPSTMVVPSDIPTLVSEDISNALARKHVFDVVISPSHSCDGTNLLFFSRTHVPALRYDSDSFWNHLRQVAKSGSSLAVTSGAGILFDVDTPEDLLELCLTESKSGRFAAEALKRHCC